MKLTYIAHACFKLEIGELKIVFDPYRSGAFGGAVGYRPVDEEADVVLTSHGHEDHNAVSEVKGNPRVITQPGKYDINGVEITGIKSYHDPNLGRERGENIVFVVKSGNISLAHLGDQGFIDETLTKQLSSVDVLLIPIGGTYTLSPHEATEFVNRLKNKLIIPMHYKTEKLGFPIKPLSDFIALNQDKEIIEINASVVELSSYLPVKENTILVLSMQNL